MTVHRDAEQWGTQLERIGKLANREKETVFNNLLSGINEESLLRAYDKLDGKKAIGIDGVSKADYGRNLLENVKNLARRIHRGNYYPQAARISEIPKEDGSTRPLAISCFEDKMVQYVTNKIVSAIYEPMFLPCSYGFRPEHNCHQALKDLKKHVEEMRDGAVVEIDIKKCFNTIPLKPLMTILQEKIADTRFLRLLWKLMTMPIIENGIETKNTKGCPQGSIISPTLANIYLHHVIDVWFARLKRTYFNGLVRMVRYADDMCFVFEEYREAEKFYQVLPKRLSKYGLEMKEEKSHILKSGAIAAFKEALNGKRLDTYQFLGFVCHWGKTVTGKWRLKYKSRRDRFTASLKRIKEKLRKNLNTEDANGLLKRTLSAIKGWINYHAISDNRRRIKSFIHKSRWLIFKWFNRRGGKRKMTWPRLLQILKNLKFPDRFKLVSMFD